MHRQGLAARNGLDCRLGLDVLFDSVVAARDQERARQGRNGVSSVELAQLRSSTLDALVAYAEALDSLAWPVPREVLQQIQLRRALLSMPVSGAVVARGSAPGG